MLYYIEKPHTADEVNPQMKQHPHGISLQRLAPVIRTGLYVLLLLNVLFIFVQSALPAEISDAQSGEIQQIVGQVFAAAYIPDLIRKAAHFLEFSALGLLLTLCTRLRSRTARIRPADPLLTGLLIALTDETLQRFIPGRSGMVVDVWIDFAGLCLGLLLGMIWLRFAPHFWQMVSERQSL